MIRTTLLAASALAIALPAAADDGRDPPRHRQHAPQPATPTAPPPPVEDHSMHQAQAEAPPAEDHSAHQAEPAAPAPMDHSAHMAEGEWMGDHSEPYRMQSPYGLYAMQRDASGTSWQPDASIHNGAHQRFGSWMVMTHALLNGVYDWQDGPRGDEKTFLSGMVMASALSEVGDSGKVNLRVMLSPDPLMGEEGYPLLLAAGESADGVTPLVDRQHPHDLFMELSASYSYEFYSGDSVYVYGGLPGEPAFGPPAFMHRMSAMDSPEAPITHHWFDSTHITFGVLTAGYVIEGMKVKLEASRFRGREPDEDRYDIETGELDSTSVRVSWNPSDELSLQASWADVTSPEALEPDEDEKRWSVSAIYTQPLGDGAWWSTTAAYANKDRSDGVALDAFFLESALHPNEDWTIFARAERIESDELEGPGHGDIHTVGRISIGAIRDWRVAEHVVFGVGALGQKTMTPDELDAAYGFDPVGAMAFMRLKIE